MLPLPPVVDACTAAMQAAGDWPGAARLLQHHPAAAQRHIHRLLGQKAEYLKA